MTPEIKKDTICISSLAAHSHCHVTVEGDTIVPDSKPDILKVLQMDASAQISKKDIQNGRVIFTGSAEFNILYMPDSDSPSVKSLSVHLPFNHIEEINSISPDMINQASCDIREAEFDLINSRKLSVRAQVMIDFKTYKNDEVPVVTYIEGENIQMKTAPLSSYTITACEEIPFSVTDTLEVPSGKPAVFEILSINAQMKNKDIKLVSNKIVTKGTLSVCTLYLTDDEKCSPQYMEHEIPFTEVLDVSGITEECLCDFNYKITDISYDLSYDSEGACRVVGVEIIITAFIKACSYIDIDMVDDCYCTQSELILKKKPCLIDEIANSFHNSITLRESFNLPADCPPIMQIYSVWAKPHIDESITSGGKMTINGTLALSVLYLSDDGEGRVFSYMHQLPFSQTVDCPDGGDITCDFNYNVDHCDYTIVNSAELDVRTILSTHATIYRQREIHLIEACEARPLEKSEEPSIVIYFVQQGDSLWNVAKRYRTTVDNILYANAIDETAEMKKGMQLIIPR